MTPDEQHIQTGPNAHVTIVSTSKVHEDVESATVQVIRSDARGVLSHFAQTSSRPRRPARRPRKYLSRAFAGFMIYLSLAAAGFAPPVRGPFTRSPTTP